jgi:hypothetical protein
MRDKLTPTIWQSAVIRAALQARERLANLDSDDAERVAQDIRLLRMGQDMWRRLKDTGMDLPEVDLTDPPPAAAAPAHVHRGKMAAGNAAD